jgi:hypothetical protein
MLRTLTRTAVIAVAATSGILGSLGTASAAPPAPRLTSLPALAAATPPTSQIKGSGSTRRFAPKAVTAAPVTGTCGPTNYSFLITNSTGTSQQLLYNGAALGKAIKPKLSLDVCAANTGSGTLTLKGDAKAKLTFTIT